METITTVASVASGSPRRRLLNVAGTAAFLSLITWSPQAFSVIPDQITPNVIFGSGNFNEAWTVNSAGNIEVGLRAKERFERNYSKSGNIYTQQAGNNGGAALWNFEWSVDLDTSGSFLPQPGIWFGFLPVLTISTDTGVGFPSVSIPTALAGNNWYGTNATANGGGTNTNILFAATTGLYVEQNSLNIGQLPTSLLGYDPNLSGTYNFELAVYGLTQQGTSLLGVELEKCDPAELQRLGILGTKLVSTDIEVRVQAVPIPAAAWLFGSGLLGLAGIARRRRG